MFFKSILIIIVFKRVTYSIKTLYNFKVSLNWNWEIKEKKKKLGN